MSKKYFVVSDVHSFYSILKQTLDDKGFDINNPDHYLILCGDLFDRGDESRGLFNFVKSLKDRFIYIRGNHEDLLFDCYNDILENIDYIYHIGEHHIHNKTVKTICDLSGITEDMLYFYSDRDQLKKKIKSSMKPTLSFIEKKAIDYFEINNYIFVHGWIPCLSDDPHYFYATKNKKLFDPDWNNPGDLSNERDQIRYKDKWKEARWLNGMECWNQGVKIPGKTIVCGHWHCSYGWSHIDQIYKEFPDRSNEEALKQSFQPYIKGGIIALDACTAYSGLINCLVIEEK